MPHITIADTTLYIADHRKAESSYLPVILVHGAGGTHLDWPANLRRLPQANAIAVDLAGHGKSPLPSHQTIEAYAKSLIHLMDALQLPQAVICGHSMGGGIAQMMALAYPQRVRGLILVGTGAKLRVHPDVLENILTHPEDVAALLKTSVWGADVPDSFREGTYTQMMNTPPEVIYGDYLACDGFDVRDRLGEISVPTLVIGGTADVMTPHKFSVYLAENIPHAQLITVEGGGHMMALEQPCFVTNAIANWLSDKDAS
jgi:pimeloyl-ACP methyl ester carboxylesterase